LSVERPTVETAAEAVSLVAALECLVCKIKEGEYRSGKWSSVLYELAVLVQNMELGKLEQSDGDYLDEVYKALPQIRFMRNALKPICKRSMWRYRFSRLKIILIFGRYRRWLLGFRIRMNSAGCLTSLKSMTLKFYFGRPRKIDDRFGCLNLRTMIANDLVWE
jgi:hypothetical protein